MYGQDANGEQQEDLSYNIFFKTLTKKYPQLYAIAEKNCHLICVPKTSSCRGLALTKTDLEHHILAPSPFFQGQYETLSKRTVEIEGNHVVAKESNGFPQTRKLKILFEELFYNKDYKPYKVLCIDAPLEGGTLDTDNDKDRIKFPTTRSFNDCKEFLESFPVNTIVLTKVLDQLNEFSKTYVIVKGFETHARKRIEPIYEQALEALLIANPDFRTFHARNNSQLINLEQIVESFVMGVLNERVFQGLSIIHCREDQAIYKRIMRLQHVSLKDLDVRPEIQYRVQEAIQELKKIDSYTTPLSKLGCVHETIAIITRTIGNRTSFQNIDAVTTDDLIPLMVDAIIQSQLENGMTSLFYMEHFIFSNIHATALGFTLVTFRAAVEYIKGEQIANLCTGTDIEDVTAFTLHDNVAVIPGTTLTTFNKANNLNNFPMDRSQSMVNLNQVATKPEPAPSPLSRKYSMPNMTVSEYNTVNNKKPPSISPRKPDYPAPQPNTQQSRRASFKPPEVITVDSRKDEDLGSFLTSLKKDSKTQSFRKSFGVL